MKIHYTDEGNLAFAESKDIQYSKLFTTEQKDLLEVEAIPEDSEILSYENTLAIHYCEAQEDYFIIGINCNILFNSYFEAISWLLENLEILP